jgi:hypothetical protein
MSKLKLKCGIRVAPFLCESRHLGTTALAALFFLLAGLALLGLHLYLGGPCPSHSLICSLQPVQRRFFCCLRISDDLANSQPG